MERRSKNCHDTDYDRLEEAQHGMRQSHYGVGRPTIEG